MNSLTDLLEIHERVTMMLESAQRILDIAKDYPPQINEHSVMYFNLSSWAGAMDTVNRQHEEAFVELEYELKPIKETHDAQA
jgi:hypothetical protein